MIVGLDSSFQLPDDAGLREAKAAGIGMWAGYMATRAGTNLGAPWPKSNFDRIKAAGMGTMGYVSGLDDPAACKAQAAAWGIRICLDVESGIRGDGAWVQAWLDASGAGLYGNPPVFAGRRAPFCVMAAYPASGPQQATWSGPAPGAPHGWQSQGTHTEFGVSVDRGCYDDFFATSGQSQGEEMAYFIVPDSNPEGILWLCQDLTLGPRRRVFSPPEATAYTATMVDKTTHTIPRFVFDAMRDETGAGQPDAKLDAIVATLSTLAPAVQFAINDPNLGLTAIKAELAAIQAAVAAIPGGGGTGADPNVQRILDAVTRIETALKGA